jgi:hypothetical protein
MKLSLTASWRKSRATASTCETKSYQNAERKTRFHQSIAAVGGRGDAFNSRKFGPAKGYFNMATTLSALPFRRTSLLVPSTRGKANTAP